MKLSIRFLFITLWVATFSFASAKETDGTRPTNAEAIETLLKSEYRPTPLDILAAFGGVLPESNIFIGPKAKINTSESGAVTLAAMKQLAEQAGKYLPLMIAAYEKSYPNALYFPMGRDAAYLADALDFFYLSAGQGQRVYRLRGSGPTIRALTNKTGPEFLISNHFGIESTRPHILMDNTSFSSTSQSRILFNFGRQILLNNGAKNSDIHKLIAVSAPSGWHVNRSKSVNEQNMKKSYNRRTLSFAREDNDFGASNLLYSGGFWHPSSGGGLKPIPTGELAGVFSGSYSAGSRKATLGFIYEVMKVVSTPEFLDNVNKELRKLNVRQLFDPADLIPLEMIELSDEEKIANLKAIEDSKMVRFNTQLGSALSRRILPRVSPYNMINNRAAKWIDLLTKEERENLDITYRKLLSLDDATLPSIKALDVELDKILSPDLTINDRLSFIISRLQKISDKERSTINKQSLNGVRISKWSDLFWFLKRSFTGQLDVSVDFVAALNTVTDAYMNGFINDFDFLMISSDLILYSSKMGEKDLKHGSPVIEKYRKLESAVKNNKNLMAALLRVREHSLASYYEGFADFLKHLEDRGLLGGKKTKKTDCEQYLAAG